MFVVDDHDSSKVPIWYVVPPNVPLSDVLRSEPFYLSDTLAVSGESVSFLSFNHFYEFLLSPVVFSCLHVQILHVIPRGSSVAPTSFKKLS